MIQNFFVRTQCRVHLKGTTCEHNFICEYLICAYDHVMTLHVHVITSCVNVITCAHMIASRVHVITIRAHMIIWRARFVDGLGFLLSQWSFLIGSIVLLNIH